MGSGPWRPRLYEGVSEKTGLRHHAQLLSAIAIATPCSSPLSQPKPRLHCPAALAAPSPIDTNARFASPDCPLQSSPVAACGHFNQCLNKRLAQRPQFFPLGADCHTREDVHLTSPTDSRRAHAVTKHLVCVAAPVFAKGGRSVRCAVALQTPVARISLAQAQERLPRLQEAAQALGRTPSLF